MRVVANKLFSISTHILHVAHDLHAKNMQSRETKWNEVLCNKNFVGANINILIGRVHWVH
jgi:hypothetical protein